MIKNSGSLTNYSVIIIFALVGLLAGGGVSDSVRRETVNSVHIQDDIADSFIRRALENKIATVQGLLEGMTNQIDLALPESGLLIRNMAPALPPWVSTVCIRTGTKEECGRRNFVGAMVSTVMPGWAANLEPENEPQSVTLEMAGQTTSVVFHSQLLSGPGHVTAYADLYGLTSSALAGASLPGYSQVEVYDLKGRILYHPNAAYIGRTWDEIEDEAFKSHARGKESDESAKKARALFISGRNGSTTYIDNNMGGTLILSHYGPFPGIPGYYFVYNRALEAGPLDFIRFQVLGCLAGAIMGALFMAFLGYWREAEGKSVRLEKMSGEKRKTEIALRELSVMIDTVASLIFVVDSKGVIARMNKSMERFLRERGMPASPGQECRASMPEGFCDNCRKMDILTDKKPCHFELESEGRIFIVSQTHFNAPDGEDLIIHVIEDITDLKSLKSALLKSEKRLSSALLAGSIAHEINNALTGVIGYADLLGENPANETLAAKTAGVVKSQLGKVILLSKNLQSLSKPPKPVKEMIDINRLFSSLAQRLLEMGVTKRFLVETKWESALPAIEGDPGMIEQALMNIILNAAFAMSDHGILRMGTERTASGVRLYVSDTGPGISQEVVARLFEPFYTTKGEEGTGLGLYVTRQIAEAHGGNVEVSSQVGKGTTMSLNFPA